MFKQHVFGQILGDDVDCTGILGDDVEVTCPRPLSLLFSVSSKDICLVKPSFNASQHGKNIMLEE